MTQEATRPPGTTARDGVARAEPAEYGALRIAEILRKPPPTPEQVEVIEAEPDQPLLVVAGAGSGKTETMASRVVWLVANGHVRPEEVLGLTFTRKAAGELAERVQQRLTVFAARTDAGSGALTVLDRPVVSTYNAYAAGLVADHGLRLGVEPGSRLLSEASQWQVAAEVVEAWAGDLDTDAAFATVVDAVRSLAGNLAEHLLAPADARERLETLARRIAAVPLGRRPAHYADVERILASLGERARLLDLVAAYGERKRALEAMDFGDQVAVAARLARDVPVVGRLERSKYRAVLLDEYQDTSHAQVELLAALFGDGHPVTAVGDPHQSIYGWRGASAGGIGRFPDRFRRALDHGAAGGRARVLSLRTSWRNDDAILGAANRTAAPLRVTSTVDVEALVARPGAGRGVVTAWFAATEAEEAEHVATVIEAARAAHGPGERPPSTAVLCRARRQFAVVEAALRRRGLPVEVVGLGGLLTTPEVVDLVAFLQVVHDPSRGDALVRLLTGPRVNLGAADLAALAGRARDLAAADERRAHLHAGETMPDSMPDTAPDTAHDDSVVVEGDVVDHRSIVDALDDLPAPGAASRDGRVLTAAAHTRLTALAADLRAVRAHTYLSLPELVTFAERSLGLDVEVDVAAALFAAGALGATELGREHLDAFRDVAVGFAQSADAPTLGGFLAWLKAAHDEERGLELPLREVDRDAVQVITVHGSKGLEWDVVAVPGLVQGTFPSVRTDADGDPVDNGWLWDRGALPYPLRGDAHDLPHLAHEDAENPQELRDAVKAFQRDAGAHQLAEERRLAYVAFTRARRELHLSGSWWRGERAQPTQPSVFLEELAADGLVDRSAWSDQPEDNPLADRTATSVWPAEASASVSPARAAVQAAADAVRDALESGATVLGVPGTDGPTDDAAGADAPVDDLVALARLLLAERADQDGARAEVAFPAHVSASGLVALAADRDAFALARRRPVPKEPSRHARRGTRFHAWVERYYGEPALLDVEELWSADDLLVGPEAPDPEDGGPWSGARGAVVDDELEALRATFLASPWAERVPLAIEADVETPVAGVVVRCRIDAVFPQTGPDGEPGAVVVDWKTGRAPRDAEARQAREVQLAAYRLAWSRWSGLPVERVSAAFYYVADGTEERPADMLDLAGLEALVRGA
ncbi:ATP-dependent DNA helicase [Luteimicrobium subarcticum]|uniref:DNA 3'-5' helicase n=1 Tax=Luteimicrobium subarcticum TaxID=620910 RepID=A0A2M8WUZ3_9MICO|nr:ATP-dependent DNA helicase [Luteimicrobium subarcticum]PJI94750.1 DNA helicase-2/ATP-dependent DNA helicase PcrA [Luteimicrobium subarcticum]